MKIFNFNRYFKQYSIVFISIVVLILSISCSGNDDNNESLTVNPQPISSNLAGHWKLTAKSINGQSQGISGCEKDYNWYEFGIDNGAIIGKFATYRSGETNYCRQNTGQGTYSVSNNILTYTSGENASVTKYNIISANSLTIRLQRFYIRTSTTETTVPIAERVIETCNKTQ